MRGLLCPMANCELQLYRYDLPAVLHGTRRLLRRSALRTSSARQARSRCVNVLLHSDQIYVFDRACAGPPHKSFSSFISFTCMPVAGVHLERRAAPMSVRFLAFVKIRVFGLRLCDQPLNFTS